MLPYLIHRRKFLATSVSALMGSAFAADELPPQPIGIPLQQEPLAFDFHALEPYLDATTLRLHYHEHHAQHLMELKQALSSVELSVACVSSLMPCILSMPRPAVERRSLLQFSAMSRGAPVKSVSQKLPQEVQDCIRHSGGAHVNHTAFWRFLNPPKSGHPGPQGKAAMHIEKEFGTFHEFKAAFTEAALNHDGSGWAWLVYRPDGRLVITTTSNEDNPLMKEFVDWRDHGRFILTLDLWEHSYYSKYKNNRKKYIEAWWNVVNWNFVSKAHAIVTGIYGL